MVPCTRERQPSLRTSSKCETAILRSASTLPGRSAFSLLAAEGEITSKTSCETRVGKMWGAGHQIRQGGSDFV